MSIETIYTADVMTTASANAKDKTLETAGVNGFISAPIIVGNDPVKIWEELYHVVDKVKIPNLQCRTDCDKSALKKLKNSKSKAGYERWRRRLSLQRYNLATRLRLAGT